MTLFLSRLRVRRTPSASALKALIDPEDTGRRIDAHHRLIWTAFADEPDRGRDFLWRDEGDGRFITLSRRPPAAGELFEPPETKPFAPDLCGDDRLAFALRANATRSVRPDPDDRSASGRVRTKHRDVVMELLHPVPGAARLPADEPSTRPAMRAEMAQRAAAVWMAEQGARHGFEPLDVALSSYDAVTLPGRRGPRKGSPRLGVLDLSGMIEVRDPEAFLAALASGFGRAKAFGCGLMLIRRA